MGIPRRAAGKRVGIEFAAGCGAAVALGLGAVRRRRFRLCVRAAQSEFQRLEPVGFQAVYVVAKATTHKDSQVLAHTLQELTPRLGRMMGGKPPVTKRRQAALPIGWSHPFGFWANPCVAFTGTR